MAPPHGDQRITGMIQESFAGLLLGILYLAARKNLVVPIVAYIVAYIAANTVALILIYADAYPGV